MRSKELLARADEIAQAIADMEYQRHDTDPELAAALRNAHRLIVALEDELAAVKRERDAVVEDLRRSFSIASTGRAGAAPLVGRARTKRHGSGVGRRNGGQTTRKKCVKPPRRR